MRAAVRTNREMMLPDPFQGHGPPSPPLCTPAIRPVDADAFERTLAGVVRTAPVRTTPGPGGGDPGLFGPGSAFWAVNREAAVFLGAGRAMLLQLAHPWVAAAISQHSDTLGNPVGRFHRTFGTVYALVFGATTDALDAARRLHRRHAAVAGTLPEGSGAYAAGMPYMANEAGALLWVHMTLVDTAAMVHERVFGPLPAAARARYYADSRRCAALFGIPDDLLPPDWPAFATAMARALDGPLLAVTPWAREAAGTLLGARVAGIRIPRWYRDVTAGLLPPHLASAFGLDRDAAALRRADRALDLAARLLPRLPRRLRHVPPYFEALERIAGRPGPSLPTRALNRLWIGRARLGG